MKPCHEEKVTVHGMHSRCNDQYVFFAGEGGVWGSKRGCVFHFHASDEEISVPKIQGPG